MKFRSSFETKVGTAFAAALLVVFALSIATWKLSRDAGEATQWVAHTHEVLGALIQVEAGTLQIELNTQNFRISGDPVHLAERDKTVAERQTVMRRLLQLLNDNPQQRERLLLLQEVIEQRLMISRQVQTLREQEGVEAANAFVATAPLKATRQRLYRLLHDMQADENSLLQRRNAEQQRTRQILTVAGALVTVLLCALLTATHILIRRQLRSTEASQRALADSEENLAITLHSIGDAVLATDSHGCITRMNAVAERLTGWSLHDARGRPIDEVFVIVNEQTRAPAIVPVSRVLATGNVQGLANHTALIARDGSECPIADSAAPIRSNDGKIRGVVLVFRDVSLERQAERMIIEQNELLEQRVEERTAQLRERENHLRSVTSNVPAMIAFVDAGQRYVYVNEQYRARFAPTLADITGCTVRQILGEERYAVAAPIIDKALQGEPQSYDWQPFAGIWQVIHYAPMRDAQGRVSGYYVLGTDITARKLAEDKITTLNDELAQHVNQLEHVSRALRTLSAGNRTMLRATDEQGLLESMCSAIVAAGGYATAVVWYRRDDEARTLLPMAESGYPAGIAALRQMPLSWADDEYGQGAVACAIRSEQTTVIQDIHHAPNYAPWLANLQGYASAIACPLRVGGVIIGALAIYDGEVDTFGPDEITLLTESADDLAFGIATLRIRAMQQKDQEAMYRLTRFDTLTGLPNETQFTEMVGSALIDGQARSRPFALLQANVERLSEINDALGFAHGDQLLCEFASRLRAAVPATAMVARLRGDEFAILLPDSDAAAAITLVQHLEGVLKPAFLIADIPLEVSAKIGVVLYPEHGAAPHDLYRHMDIALHQAKSNSTRYAFFNPALHVDQARRLTIASELRQAIEGGDLRLYLQPKVDMVSGLVCGAEGLVRWQHASRGLMPPSEFIGLAESTGLIKPLTEWVVETALSLNQVWARQGCALPIAVNFSALNLRDESLLDTVRRLQARYASPPGLFEIELTESAVMADAEFALHVLHALRLQGIPLYIDDFGTGYSSLSYLQKLPVEYIKIDQSFVRDMISNKDSQRIVRSTIDLVHDLGRKVVAEGIESREVWDQLAGLGCDMAQGYFIARPMPAEAFPDWAKDFQAIVAGEGGTA